MSSTLNRLRSGIYLTRLHAKAKDWLLAYYTASTTVSLIALFTTHSLLILNR
jgi:hypothetical protein